MIVRLTTDASLCYQTRAGAWGAIARRGKRSASFGAALPGRFGAVNGLELHAVAHGLVAAIEAGIIRRGDHVVVQTDSQHAASRINPNYVSRRNKRRLRRGHPIPKQDVGHPLASPKAKFWHLMREHELTWEVVHSNEGYDLHVADTIAGEYMLEERYRRQGLDPMAAKLAAFERTMDLARAAWINQILRDQEAASA